MAALHHESYGLVGSVAVHGGYGLWGISAVASSAIRMKVDLLLYRLDHAGAAVEHGQYAAFLLDADRHVQDISMPPEAKDPSDGEACDGETDVLPK
eukprot:12921815-Prorocentrum_lima.AAC.1